MSTTTVTDWRELAADPAHVAFARRLAKRYSRDFPHLADEFESAAMLGLVQAAKSYDPARGTRFTTHAGHRVCGAIKDAARQVGLAGYRQRNRPRGAECDAAPAVFSLLELDDGDRPEFYREGLPVGWEVDAADAVERLTRCLPASERDVVRRLHLDASTPTYARLGLAIGVSETRAAQIYKSGIARLRARHGTTTGGD